VIHLWSIIDAALYEPPVRYRDRCHGYPRRYGRYDRYRDRYGRYA
jgi:hypothetical protein